MLVLALDTATPAVTAGVVEMTASGPVVRAARVARDARKHGELLMPAVLGACADAEVALRDVDAVVTGIGPGPFTGLRVGMVTAAALGDGLDVPVHGVGTLDAIALDTLAAAGPDDPAAGSGGALLVVTDARRREVYWATYDGHGQRLSGPHVESPAALAERVPGSGIVAVSGSWPADLPVDELGLTPRGPAAPTPAGLVAAAADALRLGAAPGPLEPLYLRRPDAEEPGSRKRVTAR